jgi:hypothetical protein
VRCHDSLSKYQWVNFHDDNALYSVVTSLETQRSKFIAEENKKIAAGETFRYQSSRVSKGNTALILLPK